MSNVTAEVKHSANGKNGYELRSDLIAMAKSLLEAEYAAKWEVWTTVTAAVDAEGNFIKDNNMPVFPTVDDVIRAAESFYGFVNNRR